jgi:hypothetical protein
MSLPLSVCITGCDSMRVLQQALGVATNFRPLTQAQIASLLTRTEVAAATGEFERYKTTNTFDNSPQDPNLASL